MGSCISKCKPKKKSKEDQCRHVQDKLVISRDPPPIISPAAADITKLPLDKPLSPAPSTSSTASFSSFSCSASTTKYAMASSISSSSSLSSSSSSSCYSSAAMRDRSFSNEFLWSCAKENPHAVGLKGKTSAEAEKAVLFPYKIHSRILEQSPTAASPPLITKTKQNVHEKAAMPKKRGRASSSTLVRQKSFRREQNFVTSTPGRGLRSSPSPSRRFHGESNRVFPVKESCCRKPVVSRGNSVSSSTPKRESFRAPIPSPSRDYAVRSDAFSQHICSRIDGGVGVVGDGEEIDIVMEDINNPLIALDCFIFL